MSRLPFGSPLQKGQRVRALKVSFGLDREIVEGIVMEDTEGCFEVMEIDVGGTPTTVFYPTETVE